MGAASERPMEGRRLQVVGLLVVGIASFSFSPILVRLASEAPALAVVTWRTVFAVAFLAPFALRRGGAELRGFTRRDWLLIAGAGVFLGLHFIAWTTSLYFTSVASASVLVTTSPIFLAVFGYLWLRERLRAATAVAIGTGVAGAVLIALGDAGGGGGSAPMLGNGLAVTAALLVSFYLLIGRVVRQRTSWLGYVFPLYTVVAVTVVVTALLAGTPLWRYDPAVYGWCALMALGPQLLGHGSFNFALRYVSAALLGLLTLVEPVGAAFMAYGLFGEVPGALTLIGIAVVLASVGVAISRPRRPRATS